MRATSQALLVGLAASLAAGCAGQAARRENPMRLPGVEPTEAAALTKQVLRDMRFEVIQPDAAPGRIETEPLVGASWFEFWREDTIGCDQVAEASIHTVLRRVSASVTPTERGCEVAVTAVRGRRSVPGGGDPGVSESFSLYRTPRMSMERSDALAAGGETWVAMGRDERLEQRILSRIYRRRSEAPPASGG